MNMEIQIYNHPQFGDIRCMKGKNDEPWFVGKDVAGVLGYSNTRDALGKHVDDEDKTTVAICDTGSNYKSQAVIINESGLYSLILSSKLDKAREFKHWVTSEVLPSIRKHGAYMTESVLTNLLDDPDYAIRLFTTLKTERQARLEAERENHLLTVKVESLEPLADYTMQILQTPNTVTVTQIAQDYGMSAVHLNQILRDLGVQYRQNEQWILYSKYKAKGYAQSNTTTYTRHDGSTGSKMFTRWTQQGRLFLYELLKGSSILPLCEMTR